MDAKTKPSLQEATARLSWHPKHLNRLNIENLPAPVVLSVCNDELGRIVGLCEALCRLVRPFEKVLDEKTDGLCELAEQILYALEELKSVHEPAVEEIKLRSRG